MTRLPVFDVVLLPPAGCAGRAVAVSRLLPGGAFVLGERLVPHLSLYMANLTPAGRDATAAALGEIARATPVLPLVADHYEHDPEHGMFEVTYRSTAELVALQDAVVAGVNPLRTGLRERDPVGRELAGYRSWAGEEARHGIESCGYDEVGALFRPHITLTRTAENVDEGELPPPEAFSTTFDTLALCEMGEHGTCLPPIAAYALSARELTNR